MWNISEAFLQLASDVTPVDVINHFEMCNCVDTNVYLKQITWNKKLSRGERILKLNFPRNDKAIRRANINYRAISIGNGTNFRLIDLNSGTGKKENLCRCHKKANIKLKNKTWQRRDHVMCGMAEKEKMCGEIGEKKRWWKSWRN